VFGVRGCWGGGEGVDGWGVVGAVAPTERANWLVDNTSDRCGYTDAQYS